MANKVLEAKAALSGCKVEITTELHVINCGECGGTYALSKKYVKKKQEHGGFWTCPYCKCGWVYSKEASEVEKLERQLAKQREATEYQRLCKEEVTGERDYFEKSRNGMKGALRKEQKKLDRVKNGVCPCCNRHFKNLERHMTGQHPEFKNE